MTIFASRASPACQKFAIALSQKRWFLRQSKGNDLVILFTVTGDLFYSVFWEFYSPNRVICDYGKAILPAFPHS